MALVKPYLKKVSAHLTENGKEDRVPGFKKGATELIKYVVAAYDEMQIFTGTNYDTEAGLGFCYTDQETCQPVFLFFNDGLRQEKY